MPPYNLLLNVSGYANTVIERIYITHLRKHFLSDSISWKIIISQTFENIKCCHYTLNTNLRRKYYSHIGFMFIFFL